MGIIIISMVYLFNLHHSISYNGPSLKLQLLMNKFHAVIIDTWWEVI